MHLVSSIEILKDINHDITSENKVGDSRGKITY
jgi:hypothetical protein